MTFAARVLQDNSQSIGQLLVSYYRPDDVLIGNGVIPYLMFENGFGSNLPPIKLTGNVKDISVHPTGDNVAIAQDSTNAFNFNYCVVAYKYSDAGFGTKFSNIPSYPIYASGSNPSSRGSGVTFTPNGLGIVFVALQATDWTPPLGLGYGPLAGGYDWSTTSGFSSVRIAYHTQPTTGRKIRVSPSQQAYAIAGNTAVVWKFGSSGYFTSRYTNPVSLFANSRDVAFNPAGTVLCFVGSVSPYIQAYAWSDSTGFGAQYSNPISLPPAQVNAIDFSPAGDAVAIAHNSSPYISVYEWDDVTGFGAKYADPTVLPAGNGLSVKFAPSGKYIAIGHNGSPYVSAYQWDAVTGFGAKFRDPSVLPSTGTTVGVEAIAWRGA